MLDEVLQALYYHYYITVVDCITTEVRRTPSEVIRVAVSISIDFIIDFIIH